MISSLNAFGKFRDQHVDHTSAQDQTRYASHQQVVLLHQVCLKRVTNTGMRGNKTAKWFEGFDLHGEIKSRPQHTHRCTECRIPNCLMNSHRVLVFKCLNIHITSNDIWMRPLRFGLTELCQWMWALVLVTVNNTNVWLFTHLTFVEPYLTVGEGTDQHVNAGCNEAVISHAVVHCVDSVRSVWTEKWKNSKHVP